MKCHYFVLLFFISSLPCIVQSTTDIVNVEVQSKIDLKHQFAFARNVIILQNRGPDVIHTYEYVLQESKPFNIQFYNSQGAELSYRESASEGSSSFVVNLQEPVRPNDKFTLLSKITFAGKIKPATKRRLEDEDQLMAFEGNQRFFSSYETKYSRIEYLVRNDSLVEVSTKPTYETRSNVVYIYYDTARLDPSRIEIVFVNNDPFLVVTSLQRTVDVNHFGKVVIEDEVVVRNDGPRLVGPYSPVFPSQQPKLKAASNWLYTHLPSSAHNIQFFDVLGNSSSTAIYHYLNYVTLKFRTRYPLYGGWKTSYNLRYEVPLYELLHVHNDLYLLEIRAIDYVIDQRPIENAVIKIILPEGARIKKVTKPKLISLRNEEVSRQGGLSVFGRPVVVFSGEDLFQNYIVNVQVEYFLKGWCLFRAPLVISLYLQIVFVVIIFGKKFMF